jgi:hypothetical protein
MEEETDWHNIVLWRSENLANYLTKGTCPRGARGRAARCEIALDLGVPFRQAAVCYSSMLPFLKLH